MEKTNNADFGYLKTVLILYYALLAGQIGFAGVVAYLILSGTFTSGTALAEQMEMLMIISLFITIMGILGSRLFFTRKLSAIQNLKNADLKLNEYRGALITRWALLEVPSIVNLLFYLLTANFVFAAFFGLLMVIFILQKPSKEGIRGELAFSPEEFHQLNN